MSCFLCCDTARYGISCFWPITQSFTGASSSRSVAPPPSTRHTFCVNLLLLLMCIAGGAGAAFISLGSFSLRQAGRNAHWAHTLS